MHPSPESKIVSREHLSHLVSHWKWQGKEVVFTNGCFDLLHPGHCDYLYKAKKLGDVLIVGLNTDESVRRLKGEHRPIQTENARAFVMASLACVDAIVLFDEDTPKELIETITPDILVKGGDYTPDQVVGKDWVEEHGGKLALINFLPGFSTTEIEKKIRMHGA